MLKEMITAGVQPGMFKRWPKASDRGSWEKLPSWMRDELIRRGEKWLDFQWPSLPVTMWLELTRTGDRAHYQNAQFERRTAVADLALAECAEHEGRFLDQLVNGIFLTCEETGWHIPAHNTYVRDTEQLPLPVAERPILDLFSTQTGMMLAFVHELLREELDGICPEITARIRFELKKRITDPYFSTFFWFMGNGVEPTNNWTVWCTRNVMLACFLTQEDPAVRLGVLRKAALSVDCYLNEYPDDGCCAEGASYYHHSPLCMFECIDVMNAVTEGAFAAAFRSDKVRKMASYIMAVNVGGPRYLNYADCDPLCGYAGVREYLFAKATAQPDMMDFASEQLNASIAENGRHLMQGSALHERLQEMFAYEEAAAHASEGREGAMSADLSGGNGFVRAASYPSVGVMIVSDGVLHFSTKAGDNTGSHKHNDTGSVIVHANGRPLLIDVGVEEYTQKTFSEQRYEIWTMQSGYHNLPTIAGHEQVGKLQHVPGLYAASSVRSGISDLEGGRQCFTSSMELKGTYEEDTPIRSYQRSVEFVSGGEIRITDAIDFSGDRTDWVLNLMTEEKPSFDASARRLAIGDIGCITFDGPVEAEISEIPVTDLRLRKNWGGNIYRTRMSPEKAVLTWRITASKI